MANKGKLNLIEALLGICMGVSGLLLLGYLLWGSVPSLASPPATATPSTSTQAVIDLWDAFEQARAAARVEAGDAQLVSASTQWQAASEEALLDGADNWSFVFYAPASGNAFDVIMSTGAARVVNQTQVWVAPKTLVEGAWRAGPRDALLVFLAYGGRAFLDEHPQAVVDLHLDERDDGGPVWTIVALDSEDRSLVSLLVDTETKQVLSE
ncbi:MAG: hypothetical protein ACE5OS_11950 [Anaerolineae bacterium]